MQGSIPPSTAFVNDFSPTLTYYDVLALHILYQDNNSKAGSLRQLVDAGALPAVPDAVMARIKPTDALPTFSPPTHEAGTTSPEQAQRP
jgi:hypothetical protein